MGRTLLSINELARRGDVDALKGLLNDERFQSSAELRTGLARALGETKDPRARAELVQMLRNRDEQADVRLMAASALGEIGDAHAVSALKDTTEDGGVPLQVRVAVSLGQIGGPASFEALTGLVRSRNATVRSHAAEALGSFDDPRAISELIQCLSDRTRKVRIYAAKSLAEIGDTSALKALKKAAEREGFLTRGSINAAATRLERRLRASGLASGDE